MDAGGTRIGSIRIGAFAPQYDAAFVAASEEAEKAPGTSDDQAMIAGFCAVVKAFVADVDTIAGQSDVLVLDLRGNFGGFGREARLLGAALSSSPLPKSFDVFPTTRRGSLQLREEPDDPPCGHVATARPVIVLTDAGTRSSGELMAAWLWHSGAVVVGERTIGAGGGLEFNSQGFILPSSGLKVRMSENFTVFDGSGTLANGEFSESRLVDLVSQNGFAPDRARPFAIQAAGLKPDLDSPTTLDDLRDGGLAQVQRAVSLLKRQGRLPVVR
jgi:C-terminal processing protease CtpA/Prc